MRTFSTSALRSQNPKVGFGLQLHLQWVVTMGLIPWKVEQECGESRATLNNMQEGEDTL